MTTKAPERLLTTMFFIATTLLLLTPIVMLAFSAANSNFSASTTITSTPPNTFVDSGLALTGSAGTYAPIYIYFNATDTNGWSSLNDSTTRVAINKSGETTRITTNCSVLSHPDALTTRYNCTLLLWYFDAPGTWSVNASINDSGNSMGQNSTTTLSVNNLDAVAVQSSSISFSGAPGTNNNAASPNPQRLNNTGNQNYTSINVTGYSFVNGANTISVGNVTVNTTNSGGAGQVLINNTQVQITNSSLLRGNNTNASIYFWLSIPTGLPAGSYNAQSNWILTAN